MTERFQMPSPAVGGKGEADWADDRGYGQQNQAKSRRPTSPLLRAVAGGPVESRPWREGVCAAFDYNQTTTIAMETGYKCGRWRTLDSAATPTAATANDDLGQWWTYGKADSKSGAPKGVEGSTPLPSALDNERPRNNLRGLFRLVTALRLVRPNSL